MSSFGQKRQRRTNRNCQSLWRRSVTVTREEIEKRIDDLALNHAARHDQDVKAELEKLRKQVAKMEERLREGLSYLGALDPIVRSMNDMIAFTVTLRGAPHS